VSERRETANQIRRAYWDAEIAVRKIGNLLRTTEAGTYMWSARHKTAISGMAAILRLISLDVPHYDIDRTARPAPPPHAGGDGRTTAGGES